MKMGNKLKKQHNYSLYMVELVRITDVLEQVNGMAK